MMTFKQLASGSSGNLYELESAGKRLMIEAGMTWKLCQALLNYEISGISGWLVTHEHKDHSISIRDVLANGIKVYASEGTLEVCGVIDNRNTEILTSFVKTHFDGWSVYAFNAWHDGVEPQGFIVSDGKEVMLFATDTYNIEYDFKTAFNIIAIECSYDKELLTKRLNNAEVNEHYARRLLTSHMEKEACKAYIKTLDLSKCREIHLLHMSSGNIDKTATVAEFEEEFMIKVVVI